MDLAVFDPWREGGFMYSPPPYWRDHRVKATPGIHIAVPPNDTAQRFAIPGMEETAAALANASSIAAESGSWAVLSSSAASMAFVVLRALGHLALRCLYIFAGLSAISNRFLTRHHAIPPPAPPSPKLQAAICTLLPPSPPPSPSLSAIASSSMKAPPPPPRSASPASDPAAPSPASKLSFSAVHINVDMAPTTPPASAPTPAPAPPAASAPTPTPTPTRAPGSPPSEVGPRPPSAGPRFNPGANNFVPNAGQRPFVPPFAGRGGPPPLPNFAPGYGGYGGAPQFGPGRGGPQTFIPGYGGRGALPPAPGATQADWNAYLARFPNHGQQQHRYF
ncbi:MAG: hypothetical protein Q9195_005100 [Heterodermia aff. obscurata]